MARAASRRLGPHRSTSASTLNASATGLGDGGTVAVWADGKTSFAGKIAATGGAGGGNGGYVEVSVNPATHDGVLDFTGSADLTAPKGATGTLLLDPYDITIEVTSPSLPPFETPCPPSCFAGGVYTPGATSVISNVTLDSQLGLSNVIVSTGLAGSLGTDAGNLAVSATVTWSKSTSLTLEANGNISIAAPIRATGAGSLTLTAGGDIVQTLGAPIDATTLTATSAAGKVVLTDGGNFVSSISGSAPEGFSFRNNGNISVGGITTTTGSIFLDAAGDGFGTITQTGPIVGPALFAVAFNDVRLNSALNSVTTLSGVAGGEFDFRNASPTLTIGPVSYFASGKILTPELLTSPAGVSGGGCDVSCPANVVIWNAGNLAVSAGSTIDNGLLAGNVVLAATESFINSAGPGAILADQAAIGKSIRPPHSETCSAGWTAARPRSGTPRSTAR